VFENKVRQPVFTYLIFLIIPKVLIQVKIKLNENTEKKKL
jgi:hypothetical protein